jgi:Raf kinase inhibitor-like YbhB/YbcL family protein
MAASCHGSLRPGDSRPKKSRCEKPSNCIIIHIMHAFRVILLVATLLAPGRKIWGEEGNTNMAFVLDSSAIEAGGAISALYTCDGRDISPPLHWEHPPAGTQSFALICDDPDAPMGTWVHWVLYNLAGSQRQLPEAVPAREKLVDGTLQGRNDFGRIGYGGPCPPRGKPHRYSFRLYALDALLPLAPGVRKKDLLKAMQGHILGQAEFLGVYGRK